MALKACRECGKTVSSSAKTCPHCGIGDPTGTIAATKRAQGLVVLALLTVMAIVIVWGLVSQNQRQPVAGANSATTAVRLGQRGTFIEGSVGCPTLRELDQLATDTSLHDKAGFHQHMENYGCISVAPGESGLNLDFSLLSGANKIRLDRNGHAYWISTVNSDGSWRFTNPN